MIKYLVGNMFEDDADCLVNTVNLEGFMGKGIAYQFKLLYPLNYKQYVKDCKDETIGIGQVTSFVEEGRTIINFPTKDRWREKTKLEYIEKGLDSFIRMLPQLKVKTIAMPPLGCGNGGMSWTIVKDIIEQKLTYLEDDYEFHIFEPSTSHKTMRSKAPKVSTSSLILLKLSLELDIFDKLRLQKVCYFLNLFYGEEYFKFSKGKYGPYSYSVDLVIKDIKEYQEYYGLKDLKEIYEHIYKTICSDKVKKKLDDMDSAMKKASRYVNNIDNNKQLEGVATVLYLIISEEAMTEKQIVSMFKSWSEYKAKKFSEEYILYCIEYLEDTGMISRKLHGEYELTTKALYA